MGMVMQIGDQPGEKLPGIIRNNHCPLPHHEILWHIGMDPKTSRCVKPGTPVFFLWDDGHNVIQQSNEIDCENIKPKDQNPTTGPYKFSSDTEGTFYFACGVYAPSHCM